VTLPRCGPDIVDNFVPSHGAAGAAERHHPSFPPLAPQVGTPPSRGRSAAAPSPSARNFTGVEARFHTPFRPGPWPRGTLIVMHTPPPSHSRPVTLPKGRIGIVAKAARRAAADGRAAPPAPAHGGGAASAVPGPHGTPIP
jgi:hypothetical protein